MIDRNAHRLRVKAGIVILAVGFLNIVGCSKPKESPNSTLSSVETTTSARPTDPAVTIQEQLHGGAFQADDALESLNGAVAAIRPLPNNEAAETKAALRDVLDTLDGAARSITDHTEAPTLAEVQKDPDGSEKRRQKAIRDTNDSIDDIREAQGTISDLLASGPPLKEKSALEIADKAIDRSIECLVDSVKLLGGQPSPER